MAYDSDRHGRRSIRLDDYDYRNAGAYFVTICTDDKRLLFGEVVRGRIRLSSCGRVAVDEWHRTEQLRDNVALDAFVVMPNHVHGIIVITENASNNERRGMMHRAPTTDDASKNDKNTARREFGRPQAGSLGRIVGTYKVAVTRRCRRECRRDFAWQRNYYERILRDRRELHLTRRYIASNPQQWYHDRLFAPTP
ncbi:MAG: transposase [Bacteroidetes bacterium QS_1_65_9]|nr:MAG: transposase [Bacteroidetes bacterium QS_1_65_9]